MASDEAEMRIAAQSTGGLDEYGVTDPYLEWQKREGVKLIQDVAFEDLSQLELGPWERKGGLGAVINIPYYRVMNDAHVVEIKPSGRSDPEHHMYEENVYIVSGRGATSIWHDEKEKTTFEWHAGSLFSIPLNSWYQHFNASGSEPTRYIAVTNAPPIMRLFDDDEFVFNTPFNFTKRFGGQEDYFSATGNLYKFRVWESNFVPNAPDMPLYSWENRGAGGVNAMLQMAGNKMTSHISEFPVGTYKKSHRHGPGAHLLILSGHGYTLMWTKPDFSDVQKYNWKKGGMAIVSSDACYHQHFNTGTTRARYLAMHPGRMGTEAPLARRTGHGGTDVSFKDGGYQVEYEDEHRRIHEIFEADLKSNGATCLMKAFVPWCTGEVGPTDERLT